MAREKSRKRKTSWNFHDQNDVEGFSETQLARNWEEGKGKDIGVEREYFNAVPLRLVN